jgi:hypothetical protein
MRENDKPGATPRHLQNCYHPPMHFRMTLNRARRTWSVLGRSWVILGLAAALMHGPLSSPARADDFVNRVNSKYADIAPDKRSDVVLLPLLAKLDPPPKAVATIQQAGLLPTGKQGWTEAVAWATGANQKAVIDALATVTKLEDDWQHSNARKPYAFGQPYGAEGVSPDLIRLKMYTELGDPPMLAAAQHLYMPALDRLVCLVNVEATRLAADGKPSDAIDRLIDLIYFAREMCDRQFFVEASWGLLNIARAEERVRDIAYTDLRSDKPAIDKERIHDQLKRLAEDNTAYLDLDRMAFPQGNRVATEQVVARVYIEKNGINEQTFATTMSRLGSTEHPLRLFSEAARWRTVAADQAVWFDARDRTKGVFDDWTMLWGTDWFDRRMKNPTAFSRLDKQKFAAIDASTPDMFELLQLRQVARVEGVGTRLSLALVGVVMTNKVLPPVCQAVRPLWMKVMEADPYNIERANGAQPPLEYFVPIRDQRRTERQQREPHTMEVFTPNGEDNFTVKLFDDVFVLYSWGSDNHRDFAKRVQNTWKTVQGADFLIWPPYLSLYRQHLLDRGDIK